MSAVGADCLMVRRSLFESVGGFHAQDFALTLNEVDLCLRIRPERLPGGVDAVCPTGPRHTARGHGGRGREALRRSGAGNVLPPLAADRCSRSGLQPQPDAQYVGRLQLQSRARLAHRMEPVLRSPVAEGHGAAGQLLGGRALSGDPATDRAGEGWPGNRAVYYDLPSIIEIERESPDVIILQGRYSEGPINEIAALASPTPMPD